MSDLPPHSMLWAVIGLGNKPIAAHRHRFGETSTGPHHAFS